jgi:hypothetical protein
MLYLLIKWRESRARLKLLNIVVNHASSKGDRVKKEIAL